MTASDNTIQSGLPSSRSYEAIGRAVIAAQLLENAIVPIMESHLLVTEADRLSDTGGLLAERNYREPIGNIIKKLEKTNSIHADFSSRLREYLDIRHQLIHRWITHRGLPHDAKSDSSLYELARQVESEARNISAILVAYMVRHANPDKVDQSTAAVFQLRMRRVFLDAHLEPPLTAEEHDGSSVGRLGPAPIGHALIERG